jgi:hypothetical protein
MGGRYFSHFNSQGLFEAAPIRAAGLHFQKRERGLFALAERCEQADDKADAVPVIG